MLNALKQLEHFCFPLDYYKLLKYLVDLLMILRRSKRTGNTHSFSYFTQNTIVRNNKSFPSPPKSASPTCYSVIFLKPFSRPVANPYQLEKETNKIRRHEFDQFGVSLSLHSTFNNPFSPSPYFNSKRQVFIFSPNSTLRVSTYFYFIDN